MGGEECSRFSSNPFWVAIAVAESNEVLLSWVEKVLDTNVALGWGDVGCSWDVTSLLVEVADARGGRAGVFIQPPCVPRASPILYRV
jgi:hypothetical protein